MHGTARTSFAISVMQAHACMHTCYVPLTGLHPLTCTRHTRVSCACRHSDVEGTTNWSVFTALMAIGGLSVACCGLFAWLSYGKLWGIASPFLL